MDKAEALSEVFWQAFCGLSAKEKHAVIERLLKDPKFREDLLDTSLILERQDEPSRPYQEFAEDLRREGRL